MFGSKMADLIILNVTWKILVLFAGLLFSPFRFFFLPWYTFLTQFERKYRLKKTLLCEGGKCSDRCLCGDSFASVKGMAFKKAVGRAAVNMIILALLTAWPVWSMVPVRMIEIKPDQQKLFDSRANINTAVISIFDRRLFTRKQSKLSWYIIIIAFTTKFLRCSCFLLMFYIKLASLYLQSMV